MQKNKSIGLKDMKRFNKVAILKAIWENGELSRTELTEKTDLSPGGISALSEELLNEGIIIEVGEGESTGGRKPVMLRINPHGGYVCAAGVTSESITYTLLNMDLQIVEEFSVDNSEEIIIESLFENLAKNIDLLISKGRTVSERLVGISISIPREYDDIDKRVMFDTGVSMDRINLDMALSSKYKAPVYIEHEINARAIAEYHLGAGKYTGDFVYIDVSEDIKSVIVQDGEILRNPVLHNSDIGHMIIDRYGPKCACGRKGCLQVFSSIGAIVKKVMVGIINGNDTQLNDYIKGDVKKVDYPLIVKCANNGDSFIKDVINEVVDALCIGILNFSALFNIHNIVVGGKVTKMKYLNDSLLRASSKYRLSESEGLTVVAAALPQEAVNVGNGAIVLSNYFKNY